MQSLWTLCRRNQGSEPNRSWRAQGPVSVSPLTLQLPRTSLQRQAVLAPRGQWVAAVSQLLSWRTSPTLAAMSPRGDLGWDSDPAAVLDGCELAWDVGMLPSQEGETPAPVRARGDRPGWPLSLGKAAQQGATRARAPTRAGVGDGPTRDSPTRPMSPLCQRPGVELLKPSRQ